MVEGRSLRGLLLFFVYALMTTGNFPLSLSAKGVESPDTRSPAQKAFHDQLLREKSPDRKVMRDPDSTCGLYIRWLRGMGPLGDRSGDFSPEGQTATVAQVTRVIEDFTRLEDAEALGAELKADIAKWPGKIEIYAVGIPWSEKDGGRAVAEMKAKIETAGLSDMVAIKSIRRPSSNGIKRIWEEIVYFAFPVPKDDSEPSTRAENKKGLQSWSISSGITITLQSLFFGTAGFSGSLANAGFSAYTTFNRPMWNNYYGKHKTSFEAWARQFWMTEYFGAGVYWASILVPAALAAVTGHGSWEALLAIFTTQGWLNFLWTKLPSTLLGTSWRKPLESGTQKWIQDEALEGRGDEARTIAAEVRKWATIYSTNVWAISIILAQATSTPIFSIINKLVGIDVSWLAGKTHLLFWDFNIGHAGLVLSAVVFGLLAKNPEWYRIAEPGFRRAKWEQFKGTIDERLKKMGEAYIRSAPLMMP